MISKIVGASLLFFAMIALMLALAGIREVELSEPFMAFLNQTSIELESYKIAIPDIPRIPTMEFLYFGGNFFEVVGQIFINFIQLWVRFINGIITILNLVILVLNTIIQLLEFIFLIIKNLITMKNSLVGA